MNDETKKKFNNFKELLDSMTERERINFFLETNLRPKFIIEQSELIGKEAGERFREHYLSYFDSMQKFKTELLEVEEEVRPQITLDMFNAKNIDLDFIETAFIPFIKIVPPKLFFQTVKLKNLQPESFNFISEVMTDRWGWDDNLICHNCKHYSYLFTAGWDDYQGCKLSESIIKGEVLYCGKFENKN